MTAAPLIGSTYVKAIHRKAKNNKTVPVRLIATNVVGAGGGKRQNICLDCSQNSYSKVVKALSSISSGLIVMDNFVPPKIIKKP